MKKIAILLIVGVAVGSYFFSQCFLEDETRDFNSLHELRDWLAEDDTDMKVKTIMNCKEPALMLVEAAKEDGYNVYPQLLTNRLYQKYYIKEEKVVKGKWTDSINDHLCNMAYIGDDIYFIEPQTDDWWYYNHFE